MLGFESSQTIIKKYLHITPLPITLSDSSPLLTQLTETCPDLRLLLWTIKTLIFVRLNAVVQRIKTVSMETHDQAMDKPTVVNLPSDRRLHNQEHLSQSTNSDRSTPAGGPDAAR